MNLATTDLVAILDRLWEMRDKAQAALESLPTGSPPAVNISGLIMQVESTIDELEDALDAERVDDLIRETDVGGTKRWEDVKADLAL